MTVSILEHFQALVAKHEESLTAYRLEQARLGEEITAKEQALEGFKQELAKKEAFKEELIREGIVAAKIVSRIEELQTLIQDTAGHIQDLKVRLSTLMAPEAGDFEKWKRFSKFLKDEHNCETAVRVNSIDDCWGFFSVENNRVNSGEFSVGLSPDRSRIVCNRSFEVMSGAKPYRTPERPQELRWLPKRLNGQSVEAAPAHEAGNISMEPVPFAFLDQTGKLILMTSFEDKPPTGFELDPKRENPKAFSDLAVSLLDTYSAIHAKESGRVDLNHEYDHAPLLKKMKDFFVQQIEHDPLEYEATDEQLSSPDIYQKIKAHWDRLGTCPWSKSIVGPLAMLKFLVENGERAGFWVAEFKNHYGFRLRTRDHTWLVGRIFIHQDKTVDVKKANIHVASKEAYHEGIKGVTMVLGNAWLWVGESH